MAMVRKMTISYKPEGELLCGNPIPMLRLANKFLEEAGFKVGDKIEVEYGKEIITIKKLNNVVQ